MNLEIIILITGLIFEIGFAIFCVVTKSSQQKARSTARVGFLVLFAVLMLTPFGKWGARWYAFAVVLLVWAVLGIIDLIRRHPEVKIFKPVVVIRKAILIFVLMVIALTPALVFPQYPPLQPTGKFGIETAAYTFIDESRVDFYSETGEYRKVNVQFWYPQTTEGVYPLVLFSHGSFGVGTSNVSLYRELASNGYVVCALSHPYQSLYSTDAAGKTTLLDKGFMREVASENPRTDPQQSFEYYQKWMGVRVGDINFVIDEVLEKVNSGASGSVYRLIDPSKLGVMGHSLGGSAALGVGRARSDLGAVMALEAPFMAEITGVDKGEFIWSTEAYPVPVLNIYSDSSWSHLEEWPQYGMNARLLSSADAVAYNVYLSGAGHFNLTDLALTSPFLTRILNGQKAEVDSAKYLTTINHLALEFFDFHLKGLGEFGPKILE
jgi:dienelactone hydrolase